MAKSGQCLLPALSCESYINRFLQPDSIVPNPTDPQEFNRYTYVDNNPLTYYDPGGHFKCNSSLGSITENLCEQIVDKWLNLLKTNGGEAGKELAREFRRRDKEDEITITISNNVSAAQYGTGNESNNFTVSSWMMGETDETHDLYNAAVFGHEIVHLKQDHDVLGIVTTGTAPGTLMGEVEAYDVESTLFINMGLPENENLTVKERKLIRETIGIGSYKNKRREDILGSGWAYNQYADYPIVRGDKWTPRKYQNLVKDMKNYWLPPWRPHRGYMDPE